MCRGLGFRLEEVGCCGLYLNVVPTGAQDAFDGLGWLYVAKAEPCPKSTREVRMRACVVCVVHERPVILLGTHFETLNPKPFGRMQGMH